MADVNCSVQPMLETLHLLAAAAVDITAPEHVEIRAEKRANGHVLWINVNGICSLRVCRIANLTVKVSE